MLERVHRRFTKRLSGLHRLSYEDRLQQLSVDSPESRRSKTDLLLCFKIMHGVIDIDKNDLFTVDCDHVTRGHDSRIRRQHTVILVNVLLNIGTIYVKIRFIQTLFLPSNAVLNL